MPANKANTTARNHFTGMARSHEKPTQLQAHALVGAGHACEQGQYHGAEPFTGMARSHEKLPQLQAGAPVGAGHACEKGVYGLNRRSCS